MPSINNIIKFNGKTIGASINNGVISIDVPISYIIRNKLKFKNAIVQKNGVIRAYQGSLNAKEIGIINLSKFKNTRKYDGNTPKFGVTLNGIKYIAKFSKESDNDCSVYCEDVASRFINKLGYKAHTTFLVVNKDGKVAVLMKDFTADGSELHQFKDTKQSSEDTGLEDKSYTYTDVCDLIVKHTKLGISYKEALLQFWNMFILDAILGNRDRHHGNWGYLVYKNGYIMAPIYDNGSCLFPDVNKQISQYYIGNIDFFRERAEKYPASLLMEFRNGRNMRTNYYEYIGRQDKNSEFESAYRQMINIGEQRVFNAILKATNNILIPWNIRNFYIDIVMYRYMHIIERLSIEECNRRLLIWRQKALILNV